jgi:cysteinyl-tRNA synthetase
LKNINDDLNTAEALAVVWNVIGDEKINVYEKKKLILKFDKFLGLKLDELPSKKEEEKIPQNILDLAKDRDVARKEKDFKKADMLREEISKLGFEIKDAENQTIIVKK